MLGAGSTSTDDAREVTVSAARRNIVANFDHELQRMKGIEHSAWAAFNAVGQYADWERPARGALGRESDERRFASIMVGQGAELKRKAWTSALEMSGVH